MKKTKKEIILESKKKGVNKSLWYKITCETLLFLKKCKNAGITSEEFHREFNGIYLNWLKYSNSKIKCHMDILIDLEKIKRKVDLKVLDLDYKIRRKIASRKSNKKSVKERVFKKSQNKCCICGCGTDLEVDHIISVKSGGNNSLENLQALCQNCNSKKG